MIKVPAREKDDNTKCCFVDNRDYSSFVGINLDPKEVAVSIFKKLKDKDVDFGDSNVAAESSFEGQINKNIATQTTSKVKDMIPISKAFITDNVQEMKTVHFDIEKDINCEDISVRN